MTRFNFSKTYVLTVIYRFAFLLFVPFLQGLLFSHLGIKALLAFYGTDLAVAVFILSVAFIRCEHSHVVLKGEALKVHTGIIVRERHNLNLKSIGSVIFTKPLSFRLFSAERLRFFSGKIRITAYLKDIDSEKILNTMRSKSERIRFSSGVFRTLLMSVSFSNALTGLLAAVPLIRRASAVIGARQTALLIEGASLEGLLRYTGLPPVLSKISALLFLCWVVGLSSEFFGEYGLSFSVFEDGFIVKKGLVTKTQAVFNRESVRALIFRQSLLMFLWGLYSCEAAVNIRPKRRIHILSASSRTRCIDAEEEVFGKKQGVGYSVKPSKAALWGYTWLPAVCLFSLSLLLIFFGRNATLKAFVSVSFAVCLIWFWFRVVAFFRSSLTVWNDFYEIKFFSGMNFTRAVFRKDNVTECKITQSIFQKKSGRCNLIFSIKNSRRLKLRIKHINFENLKF